MDKIKFLQLLSRHFKSNFSFRESFLVFAAAGESPKPKPEAERRIPAEANAQSRKAVETQAQTARKAEEEKTAQGLTFDIKTQTDFNNIMDDIDEDGVQAFVNASSGNIDNLITFADGNTKNMEKILEAVNDEEIHVNKLSKDALQKLMTFAAVKDDDEDLAETVIDAAEEDKARDEQLIQLMDFYKGKGEKHEEVMSAIFGAIIECKNVKSSHELHNRLLNHSLENNDKEKLSTYLDKFKYWTMTVSLMLKAGQGKSIETWFVKEIHKNIKDNSKVFSELHPKDIVILIKNIGSNNILPKLNTSQKIGLILQSDIAIDEKDEILAKTPVNDIDASSKIKIINKTELNFESRKVMYEHGLSEDDKLKVSEEVRKSFGEKVEEKTPKPEEDTPEVKEGKKAEKVKFETINLSEVFKDTGINIDANKGKSMGWTFTIPTVGESKRSFLKTPEFKTQFAEAYNAGKLNTPEKVKLFCYKWLLEEVYAKPGIKGNRYKVKGFKESQAMLRSEIEALSKTVEGQADGKPAQAGEVEPPAADVATEYPRLKGNTITIPSGKGKTIDLKLDEDTKWSHHAMEGENFEIHTTDKGDVFVIDNKNEASFIYNTEESEVLKWEMHGATDISKEQEAVLQKAALLAEKYKGKPKATPGTAGDTAPRPATEPQAASPTARVEGPPAPGTPADGPRPAEAPTAPAAPTSRSPEATKETTTQKEAAIKQEIEKIEALAKLALVEEELSKELGQDIARRITFTKVPKTTVYEINVDGKKTDYVLDIDGTFSGGKYNIFFGIKKRNTKTEYKTLTEWSDEKVKDQFKAIARSINNTEGLTEENTQKALTKFKEQGLEFKPESPKSINVSQYETLKEASTKFQGIFANASNAFEAIGGLKSIGRILGTNFEKNYQIELTEAKTKQTFNWSSAIPENNGFGAQGQLIDKILELKKVEFGNNSEAYETFFMQSRVAKIEEERESSRSTKLKEYREKYKKFTTQVFTIDYRIGNLFESDIANKFARFSGHGNVERVMEKAPFNVSQRRAGLVASKMISEDDNARIYFEDIFEYQEFLPGFKTLIAEGKVSKGLFDDADDFLAKYEELVATGKDPELEAYMFEKIIGPCIELLDAIGRLKFEENQAGDNIMDYQEPLEIAQKSIPKEQLPIIESLQSLFNYSEDSSNFWEDFLGWVAGAEKITMANMDGTTFDVDQGMFQRHFDPKAALFIMMEKPGLYTIENGQKKLNETAILAEVNRLMLRGYITKELAAVKPIDGKKLTPKEVTDIQERMEKESAKYKISSLRNQTFTEDQMIAFQLGFLNNEIEESESKIGQGMERYLNEVFKDEKPLEPGERKLLLEVIKQQGKVKPEHLKEIRPKLAEAGQRLKEYVASRGKISTNLIHGHFHFNDSGELVGGGIMMPFQLSDGATLSIGLGAAKGAPGGVFAGLDFSFKIAGGEGWNVSYFAGVSIMGAATGFKGTHEIADGVDLWWMAGLSATWSDVLNFGVGAGVGVSYDKWLLKKQEEAATEEVTEKTGWNKETLRKWSTLSADEKYAVLEESPQWEYIQAIITKYPEYLTKENVVRAYDREMENLKGQIDKLVELPAPSPIPVGIGVGGIAPAAITALAAVLSGSGAGAALLAAGGVALLFGAKFRLGTIEIFIPHPKDEQHILELASDANVRAQVEKLLAQIKSGEVPVEFTERTPDVYWKPGSGLGKGIRIENKEVNLSSLRTDIETYNEALEKGGVETQLKRHEDGKIEMQIDNLFNSDGVADKDLEVHIDPSLYALGAIFDGKKVFLEGNIDDLIITRERFRFSHLQGEKGRTSIRDVITIRQKSSLSGKQKIDRQWLQEFEPEYREILMGQKEFHFQEGLNPGSGYGNMRTLAGFAKMEGKWEEKPELKALYQYRPEFMKRGNEGKVLDKAKIEQYKADIKRRHNALGAVTKEAFDAEKPRASFEGKMRKLFIDPEFHEKFGEIVDKPEKIVDFVKEYTDTHPEFGLNNLTHKEITIAENFLRDAWFTTAYRAEGSLGKLELDKALISKLQKAGFRNIRNLDILSAVDIKEAFAKKKISISDEEAAKIVEAVQKFKEKPLSKAELITKNAQLRNRIIQVRNYCASKFIAAFGDVIGKMNPPLSNTNAKDLVEKHFMKGVYEGILQKLSDKTNPIDFRKIGVESILPGSDLISGTRIITGSKRIRALSHTLFEQPTKSEVQIHNFGFLNGTTKEYSLNGTGVERDIARILLEMASPIPEDDVELLKSTFAIKILGLGAHRLIAGDEEYQLMSELCENPSKANQEKYKAAMANFRKLVQEIRKSQHEKGVYTYKSDRGYTVVIDIVKETAIKSGAYTQCTNPSFYVNERGIASARGQKRGVVAAREDITQVADAETDIASVTFSLSGGVGLERKPKEKVEGKAGGGGKTGGGQGGDSKDGIGDEIEEPQDSNGE